MPLVRVKMAALATNVQTTTPITVAVLTRTTATTAKYVSRFGHDDDGHNYYGKKTVEWNIHNEMIDRYRGAQARFAITMISWLGGRMG